MVLINLNIEVSAVKGALDTVKRKIPSATAKGISRAGVFIENAIKDRTRKGTDFKGRKFRPYSPKYAKRREKEGRTTTPNLFRAGLMLGNMRFKRLSKNKGQIRFPARRQNLKAFYHDVQGVGKYKVKREFFSVGKKEEERAVKIFTKTFEQEIKI